MNFDLGKFRFHFAGEWDPVATYTQNDVVRYGGNLYVYVNVTSSASVNPETTSHWGLMLKGFNFRNQFTPNTSYKLGEGVSFGGKVFVCIMDTDGTPACDPPNATYWSQFVDGLQWEGEYSPTATYQKNDIVSYGGSSYIARGTMTGVTPVKGLDWDSFVGGISNRGVFDPAVQYIKDDLVQYGPNLYLALKNSLGVVPTDTLSWGLYLQGTSFKGTWVSTKSYYMNDLVSFGANLYRSKIEQINVLPTTANSWDLIVSGIVYKGTWGLTTQYGDGDVVLYGGSLYRAKGAPVRGSQPINALDWDKLIGGFSYRGSWVSGVEYFPGDVVTDGVSSFVATTGFTSGLSIAADGSKWDYLVRGATGVPVCTSADNGKVLKVISGNPVWSSSTGFIGFVEMVM